MGVVIIAEAGVNHNGCILTAKKLIDAASDAGVDYVKFQSFFTKQVLSKIAEKVDYQKVNTGNSIETQFEMIEKLELSEQDQYELFSYCKKKGVKFLSSPFDLKSIDILHNLKLETLKIPSGEITNLPYLRKIAKYFPKIIMSTGMANMEEVKDALDVLIQNGANKKNVTILHCNTEYPTPMEDVNLKAMLHIKRDLGVAVGYSDHTLGIEVPIAAVALGATVIEKHFTLDLTLPGPDHPASLEPDELCAMVKAIRNIEKAMAGSGEKSISPSERKNISLVRKSIVAAQSIKKGEVLSITNLTTKRPGNGISPMHWDAVVGQIATKNYHEDDLIEWL